MTPAAYKAALTTLGLTPRDVCAWLGVSRRGEALWRVNGPSNLAGRLIEMQLRLAGLDRYDILHDDREWCEDGEWVQYDAVAEMMGI